MILATVNFNRQIFTSAKFPNIKAYLLICKFMNLQLILIKFHVVVSAEMH